MKIGIKQIDKDTYIVFFERDNYRFFLDLKGSLNQCKKTVVALKFVFESFVESTTKTINLDYSHIEILPTISIMHVKKLYEGI